MIVYLPEVEIRTKNYAVEWVADRSLVSPNTAYCSLLEAQKSSFRIATQSIVLWRRFYKDLHVLPKIRKIEILAGVS